MGMAQDETLRRLREKMRLAQTIPCKKCGAAIGEPCLTVGGNPTMTPHLRRNRHGHDLFSRNEREALKNK